jgi:hypothetical protein
MGNAKRDDKAVFDAGALSAPAADVDKGDRASAEKSFEADWRQKRSANSATRRTVEGFEDRWAAGFAKIDGRHVAADGMVSRRGRRRIIPDSGPGAAWLEWRIEELATVAKEVLRGRNATVFEGRVLNPLMGRAQRSIQDLSDQLGRPPKRIYKILDECRHRIEEHRRNPPVEDAKGNHWKRSLRETRIEDLDCHFLDDIDERPGVRLPVVFCGVRDGRDVYADLIPLIGEAPQLGTHWYVRRK